MGAAGADADDGELAAEAGRVLGGRFSPAVCLAALTAAAFVAACWQPEGRFGVAFDDSWIHLAFARTFVETGRWALTPFAPVSSGTTGYAWGALLAAQMAVGVPAGAAAVLPGAAAFVGLVWLWTRVAREALRDAFLAEVSGCALALSGNLLYLAVSGMEAVPMLFLALLALDAAAAGRWRRYRTAAALLPLVRPEGVLAGVVAAARARTARLLAPAAGGLAVLLAVNLALGGRLMPETFQGRRWLANLPPQVDLRPAVQASYAKRFCVDWWEDLRDYTWSLAFAGYGGQGAGQAIDERLAGPWVLLAALGLGWATACRRGAMRSVLLWAASHNALYIVMLSTPGPAGRYQPINALLAAALPAFGSAGLTAWLPAGKRVWRALAAGLLVPAALNGAIWLRATANATRQLESVHCAAARWAAEHLPAEARIAAFDFGAIAFFANRPVVDFGGLTDPEAARALHDARLLQVLRARGATHLALVLSPGAPLKQMLASFGLYGRRGDAAPRMDLKLLAAWSIPKDAFWHFHLTGNAHPRMEIFEIAWR